MTSTRQARAKARLAARIQQLEAKLRENEEKIEQAEAKADALASDDPEAVMSWWAEKLEQEHPEVVLAYRSSQTELPPRLAPGRPQPQWPAPQAPVQAPALSLEDVLRQIAPEEYAAHRGELGVAQADGNRIGRNINKPASTGGLFGDLSPHEYAKLTHHGQ